MKKWQKIAAIGCGGCSTILFLGILTLIGSFFYLRHTIQGKEVHQATGTIPVFPQINVTAPDKFLNDLMLSPFWKVEKDRNGSLIALARTIGTDGYSDETGAFLFEFMSNPNHQLPSDYRIQNRYLRGNKTFSSFNITVIFRKPEDEHIPIAESGQKVIIPVFESFTDAIGLNSSSDLAIKLSKQHEIYMILHEQGPDPERKTTFVQIRSAVQEIASLANAPKTYRVEDRYAAFFNTFFRPPYQEYALERFSGVQDRDTFYGYFRVKPNTSYAGINIKISHPVYCLGEGTRKYSRLQKAEYLGKPYQDGDLVFFLIEDNAVYLLDKYDQRFGIFSGKESFEGDLEVLNDQEQVLLRTKVSLRDGKDSKHIRFRRQSVETNHIGCRFVAPSAETVASTTPSHPSIASFHLDLP